MNRPGFQIKLTKKAATNLFRRIKNFTKNINVSIDIFLNCLAIYFIQNLSLTRL